MNSKFFENIEETPVDNLNLDFEKLLIDERLKDILKDVFKFDKLTPVQAATIPLMIQNKDVIVEAKTGSGKTLSFLLPLLESIIKFDEKSKIPIKPFDVLAIILSPTRELASQIYEDLYSFSKRLTLKEDKPLKVQLIVGGKKQKNDLMKYNKFGANIIVATPGRLAEMLEKPEEYKLADSVRQNVKFLILDEADNLLSLGFETSISTIFSFLPKQRRTSLFSATQTDQVEQLIKTGMRNPIRIDMNQKDVCNNDVLAEAKAKTFSMPVKLKNYFQLWDYYSEKLASAIFMIKSGKYQKVVVFFSTCCQVDYFEQCFKNELKTSNIPIFKIHRRLKNKRKAIFAKLKTLNRYVFIATDILCRGIDIPELSCVIHMDLPQNPESYVHRSGRSGHQLNQKGISMLMSQRHEYEFVEYCRRKNIDLKQLAIKDGDKLAIQQMAIDIEQNLQEHCKANEASSTLANQAFVSYIRFYTSKLCIRQLLFPKLDVEALRKSFGLITLPKMFELKNLERPRSKLMRTKLKNKSMEPED